MLSLSIYILFALLIAGATIFLTYRFRLNPFFILIPASFIIGMTGGVSPANTITAIRNGIGATLAYYGIIIIAGTTITVIMEKTGAITAIAMRILEIAGNKKSPTLLTLAGGIFSVSSPSETGFILFSNAGKLIERENGLRAGAVTILLATGIYTIHSLVPPAAGPLAAAGILNAGILKIFFTAIVSSVAGITVTYLWCSRFLSEKRDIITHINDKKHIIDSDLPSFNLSILPVIAPLVLITLKSITTLSSKPFGTGKAASFFEFSGDPSVAVLIGLLLSMILLKRKDLGSIFTEWCAESIERSSKILVMVAAGGAFGAVLKTMPVTKFISENFTFTGAGLLLPFLIAAAVKTINGSSTIAIITASSISAAFVASKGLDPALTVAAITAGSMMISHANDPYFWIVSQYSGITLKETYRHFSLVTVIAAIASFIPVWLLSLIF